MHACAASSSAGLAARNAQRRADIANDLEEYLGHLNRTAFTIGAGPKLDFAEAALVIQSSACVYSRKVDFLHTLVYQALEAVRTKKRNAEAAAAAADGDGADADDAPPGATQKAAKGRRAAAADAADLEDDTLEGFLSAGLQLPTSNDVDLPAAPPDDDGAPGGQSATFSLTRVPAALLALEDQRGTGNGGGGSSAGGVLGDGDAGCCRLSACTVHVSGALLLDANDADVYDGRLGNRGGRAACGSSGQQHQQQQQQLWLTQHGTQAPGSLQVRRENTCGSCGGCRSCCWCGSDMRGREGCKRARVASAPQRGGTRMPAWRPRPFCRATARRAARPRQARRRSLAAVTTRTRRAEVA